MKPLEIKMPIATVSEGNDRSHWSVRYRRRKKQREDFRLLWRPEYTRQITLPCRVTFTRFASKCLDAGDNLNSAFKSLRDEICAILGIDDGDINKISFHYEQVKTVKRENYFVIKVENKYEKK